MFWKKKARRIQNYILNNFANINLNSSYACRYLLGKDTMMLLSARNILYLDPDNDYTGDTHNIP